MTWHLNCKFGPPSNEQRLVENNNILNFYN
jgi:hypothetical protein